MIDDHAPPILMPTLKAGVLAGLVTALPLVGAILLAGCCSPVLGCGFLASFWYGKECRRSGVGFTPSMGGTVGLVAGAFWAVVVTVFAVLTWPGIDAFSDSVEALWESLGQATPENLDALERFRAFYENSSGPMLVLTVFFLYLLIAAVFSSIGGLIGGSVFRVQGAKPEPPGTGDEKP